LLLLSQLELYITKPSPPLTGFEASVPVDYIIIGGIVKTQYSSSESVLLALPLHIPDDVPAIVLYLFYRFHFGSAFPINSGL